MEAAKASFVEMRRAREEREMRTSMEAIQAGYEDAQRRAMAQRDAEMARARARYATSTQQGSAEYQIYAADMAKVTAPKAPLPANRKLPEYVIDPTRAPGLPNRDHNAPITVALTATMPRGDRDWVPMIDTRTNRVDKSYMGAPSHWMPYGAVAMTPDMRRTLGVHLDNVVECSINHKLANGRPVTHGEARPG